MSAPAPAGGTYAPAPAPPRGRRFPHPRRLQGHVSGLPEQVCAFAMAPQHLG